MTLTILLLELSLLTAAGYTLSIRWGNTPAESGAFALLLPLMALTVGIEIALLLNLPWIGWVGEGVLAIAAISVLICAKNKPVVIWGHILHTIKSHPLAASVFSLVYLLFFIQLFSGNLEPLETNGEKGPGDSHLKMLPGNVQALNVWLTHAHGTAARILPALMAFGAITFATYALARRYAWPPTAMTVTLMVISMPRLVCLASAGSTEISHTAGCLLSLLILYRLVERPYGRDLFLLLLTLGFCVSMTWLQWLYPATIVPLAVILILRRHGTLFFRAFVTPQSIMAAWLLIPTALFVIYPLLTWSLVKMGPAGKVLGLPLNPDGIQGALANGLRYLLEAIHFTLPVDRLVHSIATHGPIDLLNRFYVSFLFPLFGNSGAIAPFQIDWAPTTDKAWFGPFGFLVALPALLYALVKGPRRLKAVAVSLVGYFFLMTLIPAWKPGNVALFTLLFTLSGFMAAFSMPPWRFSTRTRYALQAISFLLLLYSMLFNPFGFLARLCPSSL